MALSNTSTHFMERAGHAEINESTYGNFIFLKANFNLKFYNLYNCYMNEKQHFKHTLIKNRYIYRKSRSVPNIGGKYILDITHLKHGLG